METEKRKTRKYEITRGTGKLERVKKIKRQKRQEKRNIIVPLFLAQKYHRTSHFFSLN